MPMGVPMAFRKITPHTPIFHNSGQSHTRGQLLTIPKQEYSSTITVGLLDIIKKQVFCLHRRMQGKTTFIKTCLDLIVALPSIQNILVKKPTMPPK